MGALAGLRVVEIGSGVAVPFAGRLLAGLGADVLKVGTPTTTIGGRYLDAGKRFADHWDATAADLILEDTPTGSSEQIALAALARPGLVITSVTPFGRTGARSGYRATELTLSHASGVAYLNRPRGFGVVRNDLAPLPIGGQPCGFFGGLAAATASLTAIGTSAAIDVSIQAASVFAIAPSLANLPYQGYVVGQAAVPASAPICLMRCRDGWIWLQCSEEQHWRDFLELMGSPDWGEWEIFSDRFTRGAHWDALEPLLLEWTLEHDAEEIFRLAQARRIPHAPAYTFDKLLANAHLQARGTFVRDGEAMLPGAPAFLSATPWTTVPRPVSVFVGRASLPDSFHRVLRDSVPKNLGRRVGQGRPTYKDGDGLPSIRVVDFSWVHAGPVCGMVLALSGAEVIKVESRRRLDILRRLPPMADRQGGPNRSGYFNSVNQAKRSVTIDISTVEGVAMARRLVRTADVAVENFSPGVMDRLGLGYDDLRRDAPDLVMLSISGYGATGPDRDYVAYGPPLAAFTGLIQATGYPESEPRGVGAAWPDPVAGMTGALLVLAALRHRARTGEGQWIDLSQAEATIQLMGDLIGEASVHGQPPRLGNTLPGVAPHDCYPCAGEDRWVAIAAIDDTAWRGMCAILPDLARFSDRRAHRAEIDHLVTAWTRTQQAEDVERILQAHGVPSAISANAADLHADPNLPFAAYPHAEVGARKVAGLPWRGLPIHGSSAPLFGADTTSVIGDLIGVPADVLADLVDRGVLQ